ncbi:hypothetical protein ACFXAZ_21620 [Streptomyces sp. NPDC059477]|uniref:hypothetical protein n=1 Tax=Streptomyces sp. NPDC059477 TaxID=3346847 RepID=UPI00368267C5
MPSAPDPATAQRMRKAFEYAASVFGLRPAGDAETWGWDGKTLSGPVTSGRWLRVAAALTEKAARAAWDGAETAQEAMPDSVPRPRLENVRQWSEATYTYRAEVHERIEGGVISSTVMPPSGLDLPDAWWGSLRNALGAVSEVPTDRVAIRQERLHWAMPEFLGIQVDTEIPEWATLHADIQWSNLVGPELCILDWERWGLGPAGYDEANLYVSSLSEPSVADRVQREFAPALASPSGRFSQLVVAGEYLQGIGRGNNLELEAPLRELVARLLG